MSRKISNQQGAILLEALLAVVILSIALTMIIQGMMSSLRASVTSAQYLKAAGLLSQVMVEQQVMASAKLNSTEESHFPVPFDQYQYTVQISNTDDQAYANLNLVRIESAVLWPGARATDGDHGPRKLAAAILTTGEMKE